MTNTIFGGPHAMFFSDRDSVPEKWRGRAVDVVRVPLLPGEAAALLDASSQPLMTLEDEELAGLVARGVSFEEMARSLSTSRSTVERRVSRLRTRLGLSTNSELIATLARLGF